MPRAGLWGASQLTGSSRTDVILPVPTVSVWQFATVSIWATLTACRQPPASSPDGPEPESPSLVTGPPGSRTQIRPRSQRVGAQMIA